MAPPSLVLDRKTCYVHRTFCSLNKMGFLLPDLHLLVHLPGRRGQFSQIAKLSAQYRNSRLPARWWRKAGQAVKLMLEHPRNAHRFAHSSLGENVPLAALLIHISSSFWTSADSSSSNVTRRRPATMEIRTPSCRERTQLVGGSLRKLGRRVNRFNLRPPRRQKQGQTGGEKRRHSN